MAQILKGIVIAVGRTVASAFTQAYNNIAYAGAKGAPEAGAAAINRAFKKPITTEEARQILDINETVALADAEEKYKKLLAANAIEKGGSFYLQSKIYRAWEHVEPELKKKGSQQPQQQ